MVRHQPHPPGYILYVALGRLASVLLADPAAALGGLAIVASAVAVLLLYRLGWHLYGRGVATLAALGLVVSPLFWAYGVVGLAYTAEAALATGVAAGAWAMRQGRVGALLSSRRPAGPGGRGAPVDAAAPEPALARDGVARLPAARARSLPVSAW